MIEFYHAAKIVNLNIDGVEVKLEKVKEKEYKICINDHGVFKRDTLPARYLNEYDREGANLLIEEFAEDLWWSKELFVTRRTGNVRNGDIFIYDHIQIILEAIVNGTTMLKQLNKPEIIKVGNVTVTKTRVPDNKVSLTIDGLTTVSDYPDKLADDHDNYIAYLVAGEIALCNPSRVRINGTDSFPTKDLLVSSSDADMIIDIITRSEQNLAAYKAEQAIVKVGDLVVYNVCEFNYKGIVLDIVDNDTCVKVDCGIVLDIELNKYITNYEYHKIPINRLTKVV